ncbi:aspartate carbamoyltransferase catalytic subunit [Oceaniglobus trochenteri]|uniref:aspartate carbamoyltransferase catalytic subunit n=1 Tax=Oceaniglobus trochenteri TaxID=2763260 RepID=UPI001CFF87B8|nr:aspartate carbamoyltransferase catalytic subunit [Oceaniglobus trochenteri]
MSSPPPGWDDILDDDEQILWQGAPDGGLHLTGGLALSGFGLFFAGFAAFWMAGAASIGNSVGIIGMIFPLFGLPFLLIGLYLVFGRFLWDAYVRRGTFYTLTDKRAYVATATAGQRRLQSYEISRDTPIELIQGPPDSIYFDTAPARTDRTTPRNRIGFRYIQDGRRVLSLLRDIQKDAA